MLAGGPAQQTDVTGRERVRVPERSQRDVVRRPVADALDRPQPRHRRVERRIRCQHPRIVGHGTGQGGQRRASRAGHAQGGEVGSRDLRRGGKQAGQAWSMQGVWQGRAAQGDQLERQLPRCADGDLLAEHSADRQLEWVPAARHTQAGVSVEQPGQPAIVPEVPAHRREITIQIQHARQTRHDLARRVDADVRGGYGEGVQLRRERHLDQRRHALDRARALIGRRCHELDAVDGPCGKPCPHHRPVVRAGHRQRCDVGGAERCG